MAIIDLMPIMTSNSQDGYIITSNNTSGSTNYYILFDKSTAVSMPLFGPDFNGGAVITVKFPKKIKLNSIIFSPFGITRPITYIKYLATDNTTWLDYTYTRDATTATITSPEIYTSGISFYPKSGDGNYLYLNEITLMGEVIKEIKSLIEVNNTIKTFENGNWVDITNNPPLSSDFQTNGISDLSIIPSEKWNELSGTIKILTWTDYNDATSSTITYTQTQYPEKTLELTVPEHRLIDQLDSPISIVTYTDAETAPSLLQQYDYPNIGARILKRG